MKINDIIDDEELLECVDGYTEVKLLRDAINYAQDENLLDEDLFADFFSKAIQGFIDEEEGTEAYLNACESNYAWGYNIAENINMFIVDKWTK